MTKGLIYLIVGNSYCCRLMVSLCSLRRVYSGPITVLFGDVDDAFIEKLLEYEACDVERIESGGKKAGAQLTKSRLDKLTPYDVTVFLDADTLVLRPFVEEMWETAEDKGFVGVQMKDWTINSGPVKKRMKAWLASGAGRDDLIHAALAQDYVAINTGVFAFVKVRSEFFQAWHDMSKEGFDKQNYIAEETACNIIMHNWGAAWLGPDFNASCRYHDDREFKTARVIHWHGLGHVRIKKSRGSCRFWCRFFESMRTHDPRFAEIVKDFSQKRERIYMDKGVPGIGYNEDEV